MPTCPKCAFSIDEEAKVCPWCENPVGNAGETTEDSGGRTVSVPIDKPSPISPEALSTLSFVGWAVAIISVIAGIATLMNTPESRYARDAAGLRTIYLAIGWSQIIGGFIAGLFFNVVAGIGRAVLDVWTAQQGKGADVMRGGTDRPI
jgi:hypothetical protein